MHYRLDIRAHVIDRGVHGDLTRAFGTTGDLIALAIDDDHVIALHHALADTGGGGKNPLRVQTDGNVAIIGGNPALLKYQLADFTDVLAVFTLSLYHAGISDCSRSYHGEPETETAAPPSFLSEGKKRVKPLQFAMLVVVGVIAGVSLMMLWDELHHGVEGSTAAVPAIAEAPGSPPNASRSIPDADPGSLVPAIETRRITPIRTRAHFLLSPTARVDGIPALPEAPSVAPNPTVLTPPAHLLPENLTPAPPRPAASRKVTLNAGIIIPVRLVDNLSIGRNKPGDAFAATLEQQLIAGNYVIAERGARVEGRVLASDSALVLALTRIRLSDGQDVAIRTDSWERRSDPLDQRPPTAVSMPARTNLRFRLGVPVSVTERAR